MKSGTAPSHDPSSGGLLSAASHLFHERYARDLTACAWREQIESASPDLLRAMVATFAEALMSAEADVVCGAPYGQRGSERINSRNRYRSRGWDTRVGSIDLAIPKLRSGSYLPDWLLTLCMPKT